MKSENSIVDDFMYGNNVAQSHITVRMGFLRKVYGIVSSQLLVTILICGAMMVMQNSFQWELKRHSYLGIVLILLNIPLLIALFIYKQRVPHNFALLATFTFTESLAIGFIVINYKVQTVLLALALTLAITLCLTLYTFQTKRDFSNMGSALFAGLFILIAAGLLRSLFFAHSPIGHMAMAVAGALLFSMFIIFDTQMIMQRVSPEEYILAAIDLYLDVINLFLHILAMLRSE